ncbi:MAG TPA: flagellar export protein FliJ [Steroidobacteraceae bacterium]|jgi:flagellar FliJ protein|nr:flagellar export protein FliJ [Steroidobacteraceae bacterium]HXS29557.1 flagellar export protein FliJ [Steroidobacteraceae bacterium]
MTRSERLAPVQRVLGQTEQQRARDLGEARQRLVAAETKLQDLQQYRQDYERVFQQRATTGQSVMALRDFQVFLARLDQAIQQQGQIAEAARGDVAGRTTRWQSAARQVKAVDSVVGRWQGEERRADDRREQKDTDERAQRGSAARTPENR